MARRRIKTFGGSARTYPIKDPKQLRRILDYLKQEIDNAKTPIKEYQAHRNYILFVLGINTAFRAEDLLQLRVKDVYTGAMSIKENKTGKSQIFNINKDIRNKVVEYVEKYELKQNDYLFMGQKKKDTYKGVTKNIIYPITRDQGLLIMKKIAKANGINYKFGLHSLRKTFGYQYYAEKHDLLTLMKMYNHTDPTVTLLYVMWGNEDVAKARNSISWV